MEILTDALLVLKPIETTGLKYDDVTDLARDTRELMLRTLVNLTAKQRGSPAHTSIEIAGNGVVKASGVETNLP